MADVPKVSHSLVSCCLNGLLDAMLTSLQEHVHFPTEETELTSFWAGAVVFTGFPNIEGAVDCTHIVSW